jgi:hypothetical protein
MGLVGYGLCDSTSLCNSQFNNAEQLLSLLLLIFEAFLPRKKKKKKSIGICFHNESLIIIGV